MKLKSSSTRMVFTPPMRHWPTTAASVRPVRRWSRNRRFRYGTLPLKESGSRELMVRNFSLKLLGSVSIWMRWRDVTL